MKIIGIEKFTYTSKTTNKQVAAANLYCIIPIKPERGEGHAFGYSEKFNTKIFCMQDQIGHLAVGDEVEVLYNGFGQVHEIRVLN